MLITFQTISWQSFTNAANPAPSIAINIAEIIGRLHSWTKPSERAPYGLRENDEDEGESALSMLGLLLKELYREAPVPS